MLAEAFQFSVSQPDTDGRGHTKQLNTATTWLLFVAKEVHCRAKDRGRYEHRQMRARHRDREQTFLSLCENMLISFIIIHYFTVICMDAFDGKDYTSIAVLVKEISTFWMYFYACVCVHTCVCVRRMGI